MSPFRKNSPKTDVLTLERHLVLAGLGNRRHCAWLVRQGRVTINDVVAKDSKKTIPHEARVVCDARPCKIAPLQTWLLHKPPGYICQTGEKSPAALDLLPKGQGLGLIGRLDRDSEGLILATNDGDLAHRLAHPDFHVPKTYRVQIRGTVTPERLGTLCSGLPLEGQPTRPLTGRLLDEPSGQGDTWLELVLTEGRKRQIRRLCEKVGLQVQRLIRTGFGPLTLGDLPPGQARQLQDAEVRALGILK